MNKYTITLFIVVACCLTITVRCREPFKPPQASLPFMVYFGSYHRGICMGTLVSRMVVLTAAICVTSTNASLVDNRPINVVVGTSYRHPKRGIRVQVTALLVPNFPNVTANRGYLMEKSPAVLLLKKKIPDILVEVPMRALDIDFKGDEQLNLQEECILAGWHFFHHWDVIYPTAKFLLQRNVRVQFVNIVKTRMWCEALTMKFQAILSSLGFVGMYDKYGLVCVRDPDRTAQACHGMYGAPLICRGRQVGMLMAPDAQWTNCTGQSNVIHLLSHPALRSFFTCIETLFSPEYRLDWLRMKQTLYSLTHSDYDYVGNMYARLVPHSGESTEEDVDQVG